MSYHNVLKRNVAYTDSDPYGKTSTKLVMNNFVSECRLVLFLIIVEKKT